LAAGKAARLKGFEFPRALHLDPHAFSIDHDLITPKMSLKRPQLFKYYHKQVIWAACTASAVAAGNWQPETYNCLPCGEALP
jgi:long-chain acyl-CoA synthetase